MADVLNAAARPTWTIHRYPAHLIDRWTAADGRVVLVRPVLPQDDELAQVFVRRLSAESRYQRFLVGLTELPPALLTYLTQIDYTSHLALIAEIFKDGEEIQVGEARYVVDPSKDDAGRVAEFAIAVADDWQRMGVGGRLLRGVEHAARAAGVTRLEGDVLRDNRRALDFMLFRGYTVGPNPEEARLVRVSKAL